MYTGIDPVFYFLLGVRVALIILGWQCPPPPKKKKITPWWTELTDGQKRKGCNLHTQTKQ